jgi:hypothetical protein
MPTPFAVVTDGTSTDRRALTTDSFAIAAELEALPPTLVIRPWIDPVVDTIGHDARSVYAEVFYLPVIGPTALWLIRRLVSGLEHYPDGYELDLGETARALGLGFTSGKAGPFLKALDRCGLFGLTRPAPDGLAVRRRVAPLPRRHVDRMPAHLREAHAAWALSREQPDELAAERATAIARVLLSAGDERDVAEHHLLAIGIEPRIASLAIARCELPPDAGATPT